MDAENLALVAANLTPLVIAREHPNPKQVVDALINIMDELRMRMNDIDRIG